jgi:thiol-disulfide isomerase/thioredoxin
MGAFWAVIAIAVVLLAAYLVRSGFLRGGGATPGPEAPSGRIQAPDLGVREASDTSRSLSLKSLRGKVVVLHFWATWCPPCRAEFPEFAKFAATAVPGGDWVVVPVSIDDTSGPVGPYVEKLAERFPVYWDEGGELANAMAVSVVPTTIILDEAGKVAWRAAGVADWSPSGVPAVAKSLSHE